MEWSGGTDYNSTPINATFTAGTTSTTVNVPLINDSIAEGPETFNLNVTIPPSLSGQVELGTIIEAVGYIIDDTSKIIRYMRFLWIYFIVLLVVIITFDELTYNVDERSGMVQVALVLSNPLSSDLTVEVTTNDVTASGRH